jgi:hypothetical protein
VQAAVDLSRGSSSAFAFLPAEPRETGLFLGGAKGEGYLQIVEFMDMQSPARRWSGGRLVWAGSVGVREFVSQVLDMAETFSSTVAVRMPTPTHGAESNFQWIRSSRSEASTAGPNRNGTHDWTTHSVGVRPATIVMAAIMTSDMLSTAVRAALRADLGGDVYRAWDGW